MGRCEVCVDLFWVKKFGKDFIRGFKNDCSLRKVCHGILTDT